MDTNGDEWVVLTTKHRGVFYGRIIKRVGTREIHLADARVCVWWSKETRGFIGLAAHGPKAGSKVSEPCPKMEVLDVTGVLHASDEAREAWEAGSWE